MAIAPIQLSDLQPILDEASLIALEYFGSSKASLECRTKDNGSPVTRADREISALLRFRLQAIAPDAG
jgi:3'-phosphoadenosine 5'-phosphosulfate (PAPS) 3'-phosphatase